jgi:hypothetical protein
VRDLRRNQAHAFDTAKTPLASLSSVLDAESKADSSRLDREYRAASFRKVCSLVAEGPIAFQPVLRKPVHAAASIFRRACTLLKHFPIEICRHSARFGMKRAIRAHKPALLPYPRAR